MAKLKKRLMSDAAVMAITMVKGDGSCVSELCCEVCWILYGDVGIFWGGGGRCKGDGRVLIDLVWVVGTVVTVVIFLVVEVVVVTVVDAVLVVAVAVLLVVVVVVVVDVSVVETFGVCVREDVDVTAGLDVGMNMPVVEVKGIGNVVASGKDACLGM
eukprot:gnl/MRDRNA2_/MRDRNA2_71350_c0_seq1.p2 gnl/MRDRNA2_/MRDRNA2_71350_c0~~gnl/MRDRNA2_/MRDRNA2_71350_c0_seq1.p2  ORF type:complete len:157 (+),score=28.01 gnl/MRDRNA2_/MRDRNA2_71350_c0_seq1:262-732(+)